MGVKYIIYGKVGIIFQTLQNKKPARSSITTPTGISKEASSFVYNQRVNLEELVLQQFQDVFLAHALVFQALDLVLQLSLALFFGNHTGRAVMVRSIG